MGKILLNPKVGRAVLEIAKLGVLAVTSIFANKVYRTAADEFISGAFKDWKHAWN